MKYSLFFVLALAACAEPISNECSTVSQPNNCGCVKHHSSNGTVRFNGVGTVNNVKTTQPEVRPSPPPPEVTPPEVTPPEGDDGDHHNDEEQHNDGEVVI